MIDPEQLKKRAKLEFNLQICERNNLFEKKPFEADSELSLKMYFQK